MSEEKNINALLSILNDIEKDSLWIPTNGWTIGINGKQIGL